MLIEVILWVGLVLFISSTCSLFEATLYSVPESHVESMANKGLRSGILLRKLRNHIDRPITAILTLNTISNTAGAAVAGAAATNAFGDIWLGYFSAGFTLAVLLFAEIIPKTVGVRFARPLSIVIARPLYYMVMFMMPLVHLVTLITRKIHRSAKRQGPSHEEIRILTHIGLREGTIHPFEGEIISNLLILDKKVAEDVMTPKERVFSLSCHMTLGEALELAKEKSYSRIPVYDNDQSDIVGMVMKHDLLTAQAEDEDEEQTIVRWIQAVFFVETDIKAKILLDEFIKRRQHLFVVIDDEGDMAGVISLEDVLEELMGQEIIDEFDNKEELRNAMRQRRVEMLQSRGKTNHKTRSLHSP